MKKILSLMLILCMMLSLLPTCGWSEMLGGEERSEVLLEEIPEELEEMAIPAAAEEEPTEAPEDERAEAAPVIVVEVAEETPVVEEFALPAEIALEAEAAPEEIIVESNIDDYLAMVLSITELPESDECQILFSSDDDSNAYGNLKLKTAYVKLENDDDQIGCMSKGTASTFRIYTLGGSGKYNIYVLDFYASDINTIDFGAVSNDWCIEAYNVEGSVFNFKYTPTKAGKYYFAVVVEETKSRKFLIFSTPSYLCVDSSSTSSALCMTKDKAKKIVEQEVSSGMSYREKALALHDWLCRNAYYDHGYTYYFANGVLLQGKGVCQSYAQAYNMMLTYAGVPNITIESTRDNHTWNLVYMDGDWLHVDVTWDDEDGSYRWFGLTDAQMKKDHHWNQIQTKDSGNWDGIVPSVAEKITAKNVTVKASPEEQRISYTAKTKYGSVLAYVPDSDQIKYDEDEGCLVIPPDFDGKVKMYIQSASMVCKAAFKTVTITVKKIKDPAKMENKTFGLSTSEQKVSMAATGAKGDVTYKSSNKKVPVDPDTGVVTIPANFKGTVTITATVQASPGYSKTTVKAKLKYDKNACPPVPPVDPDYTD